MGVSKDVAAAMSNSNDASNSLISSLEAEADNLVGSANRLSSRSFHEVGGVFSMVESHLAADVRLGVEEAKKIVADIRAKL